MSTQYEKAFKSPEFDWTPEAAKAVKYFPSTIHFEWPNDMPVIQELIQIQFYFYLGTKESEWSDWGNNTAWSNGRTEYPKEIPGMRVPFSRNVTIPKGWFCFRLFYDKGSIPMAIEAFTSNEIEFIDGDIFKITRRGRVEWQGRTGTYRGNGYGVSDNPPIQPGEIPDYDMYSPSDRMGRNFKMGNVSGVPRLTKPKTEDNWYTRRMTCQCRNCVNYEGPWYQDESVQPICLTGSCSGGCFVGCKAGCCGRCMRTGDGEGSCAVCSPLRYYRDNEYLRDGVQPNQLPRYSVPYVPNNNCGCADSRFCKHNN